MFQNLSSVSFRCIIYLFIFFCFYVLVIWDSLIFYTWIQNSNSSLKFVVKLLLHFGESEYISAKYVSGFLIWKYVWTAMENRLLYFFNQSNNRTSNLFSSHSFFPVICDDIFKFNLEQHPLLHRPANCSGLTTCEVYFKSYIVGCSQDLISIVIHRISFFEMFLSIVSPRESFLYFGAPGVL